MTHSPKFSALIAPILLATVLFGIANSAAPDSILANADKFYAKGEFEQAAAAYNSVCAALNQKDKKLCLFSEVKSLIESKKMENLQSAEIKLSALLSQTEPSDSLFSPLFATDSRLQIMLTQPERAVRSWNAAAQSANPDYFPIIYATCIDLIEAFPSKGLTKENCQKVLPADTTLISLPRTKTVPIAKTASASSSAKPPVTAAPKTAQTTAPSTAASLQCAVQLGAFGKKENADKLTANFKAKGVNLYTTESDDKKLFIVRTGTFTNANDAKLYAEQKIAPAHSDYKVICK